MSRHGAYHHAKGEWLGILDLIEKGCGLDRGGAVNWLAARHGATLGAGSRRERAAWAARRASAERRADDLTDWRAERLASLRVARDSRWSCYNLADRWRLRNAGRRLDDWRWSASLCFVHDCAIGDSLNEELERIEQMSPRELERLRAGGAR